MFSVDAMVHELPHTHGQTNKRIANSADKAASGLKEKLRICKKGKRCSFETLPNITSSFLTNGYFQSHQRSYNSDVPYVHVVIKSHSVDANAKVYQ